MQVWVMQEMRQVGAEMQKYGWKMDEQRSVYGVNVRMKWTRKGEESNELAMWCARHECSSVLGNRFGRPDQEYAR